MKKIGLLLLFLPALAAAQYPATSYQYRKASLCEELGVGRNDIVLLGSDIADNGEWVELLDNRHIANRGIRGETTADILRRIERICEGKPRKLLILPGTEELADGTPSSDIAGNIGRIIEIVKRKSPRTRLSIFGLTPVNDGFGIPKKYKGLNPHIKVTNAQIAAICKAKGAAYVDPGQGLADTEGNLSTRYTDDGIHLTGEGYIILRDIIKNKLK